MNACRFGFLAVFCLAWASLSPAELPAAEEPTAGKVIEVTLYRQQALVTRRIPVAAKQGNLEVVVSDLPEQIVDGSLFAEGPDGLEIRAVRLRSRAVGQQPREEVQKLDDAIEDVNDEVEANNNAQQLLVKRTEYLDKLDGFVAPTAKTELSKGVLDADSLQKVTLFVVEQRADIGTQTLKLKKEARELAKKLSLLQRQRNEITGGASKTVKEAIIFLEKQDEAASSVRLNYLVGDCGWSPSYTFRAGKDRKSVRTEYNALIHQRTGEDWSGVELTLSTASPALGAAGPGLAPFHVALDVSQGGQKGQMMASQQEITQQLKSFKYEQFNANTLNRSTFNIRDNIESSWTINDLACSIHLLELTGGKEIVDTLELASADAGEAPSLSYSIEAKVSLASRNDQQMVRILQSECDSDFYHVATPVLTSYVYREAELTNASGHDLLAGPMTVYLDGRFVGRGEIPTVARGQTFVVGFGADPQLRVRRELVDKDDRVQGGNRELAITYRLVAENFKDQAIPVRMYDRLPYANHSADVRVTLQEGDDKVSGDKLYARRERPKGILRWDVEVAASATGEDARLVEYGYTVEYDRNYRLTSLNGNKEQLQQEFKDLQYGRLRH